MRDDWSRRQSTFDSVYAGGIRPGNDLLQLKYFCNVPCAA